MYDVAIIGTGPAGIAAAINVQIRNRSLALFGAHAVSGKLLSAKEIQNYPGLPGIAGGALAEAFAAHLHRMGIAPFSKAIDHIYPMGDQYALTCGDEVWEARSVILATGVSAERPLPGEEELLGRGVSYCATCDGRLYRGGHVMVLAYDEHAEEEAKYLSELARVTYVPCFKGARSPENMEVIENARPRALRAQDRHVFLDTDRGTLEADCAFVLRSAIQPGTLVPGLETDNGHVRVARDLSTNLAGVFAAGDVTGTPYQIAKAVGEGATAGLSAVKYVSAFQSRGGTGEEP